jgi:hypothetical protein
MTERYGSGYGDEGGQRPSGRGAVTERLARHDHGAHEIDLTDEATRRDQAEGTADRPDADADADQDTGREAAGAFEPAPETADPPADATRPGSASIFDVGERAKQEDQERTGYEPAVSGADPAEPRGETVVTEPGESRRDAGDITPTPVPVAEPSAGASTAPGLPEPPAASTTPPDTGTAASLLGSLDADDLRSRFLDIQAGFVDEPRQAVEQAGRFVDDLVKQVVDALQGQRGRLTDTGGEASTEDLRLALRAYRQFVDRLLGLAS